MDPRPLVRSLHSTRFIRFLLAGVVNTLFGLGVYAGGIFLGLPAWLSLLISTVAGVAFNFMTMGAYAFRDLSLERAPRFAGCYGIVYLVNLEAYKLLHVSIASPVWCQVILTPAMALLSYSLMSRFVFRRATAS